MYRLISQDFEILRDALADYREHLIPEGDPLNDQKWDAICCVMAWIQEDLELDY